MKEAEIREQVRQQKRFYKKCTELAIFNAVLIVVWLLFDMGSVFWPKYVILVSIAGAAVKMYQYGLMPLYAKKFQGVQKKVVAITDDWEKTKIDEMMGRKTKTANTSKAKAKPKATTKKAKPAQKKVVARTKKTASK